MAGRLQRAFNAMTHKLERRKPAPTTNPVNPAQRLADLYRGSFDFVDATTNKKHQLAVSADLAIAIDGKQLPGKIVGITTDALTFLDHFGYELIISCKDGFPVTIYDEAEDQTYTIIYPELNPDKQD
ncbi:DUF4828 domain-containing protein [Lacticaseibacillus pabuli]|uniref:DUF4828 domain-containing protein n=1 Tax=Lacticaseibacillus pabuli TaxID=3025672 RepID=A0ABY7WTI5_9LACO|nr:DUF4828 domain-containing protein [Lacticaseibacillus sp. KACC 23028]WDF83473.1 DUF4828 domain-containing protein [Lacticaseibacillus sp. KACC 23028]